jgi:hypothetical protein
MIVETKARCQKCPYGAKPLRFANTAAALPRLDGRANFS